jgi:RHS repeat-associated protein
VYDDEGNTILGTRISGAEPDGSVLREFTWDHRNRLTAGIDKNGDGAATQIVRFTYDAVDRRVSKSVDTTPSDAIDAAIMHFAYDREDVILDFVDPDGHSGPAEPSFSQRYLHGLGIDQVLAQDDSHGTTHWHLTDHLGTVRDLATANGAIAEHLDYDSFGRLLSPSSTRFAFTGREADIETALIYYRSRYYHASNGIFISEDWLGFATDDTNVRRYVRNSPQTYIDPFGRDRSVYNDVPSRPPLPPDDWPDIDADGPFATPTPRPKPTPFRPPGNSGFGNDRPNWWYDPPPGFRKIIEDFVKNVVTDRYPRVRDVLRGLKVWDLWNKFQNGTLEQKDFANPLTRSIIEEFERLADDYCSRNPGMCTQSTCPTK